MCLPLAAAATVAAGVTSAAGSIMGGMQANAQGRYEQNVARQNARLASESARDSITRGRDESKRFFRQAGAIKGSQRASMAANGLDMSFGAPLRIEEDTAALLSEDAKNLYANIEQRTRGFDIDFSNQVAAGRAARARGKAARTQSYFQAAGTLLSTASQARGMKPMGAR